MNVIILPSLATWFQAAKAHETRENTLHTAPSVCKLVKAGSERNPMRNRLPPCATVCPMHPASSCLVRARQSAQLAQRITALYRRYITAGSPVVFGRQSAHQSPQVPASELHAPICQSFTQFYAEHPTPCSLSACSGSQLPVGHTQAPPPAFAALVLALVITSGRSSHHHPASHRFRRLARYHRGQRGP